MKNAAVVAAVAALASGSTASAGLIDTMRHDIFVVHPKNFDQVITSHRTTGVAVVAYYDNSKESQRFIDGECNEAAKETRGMVKVAGLDCDEWPKFCEDQGVTSFPAIFIYPPQPFMPQEHKGAKTAGAIKSAALRHIPADNVKILHSERKTEMDMFLTTSVAVPKVILFSNKEKPPVLMNALANSFTDRMFFGFIPHTDQVSLDKFKVETFPTLLVLKGELTPGKTGEVYTGEMNFPALHEWINIRSETFVKGGGYASQETAEQMKPWLVQKIPEITRDSHQDVCFRHKALCLMYVTKSGAPSDSDIAMLEKISDYYQAVASDRTANIKISWVDATLEKAFAALVGVSTETTVFPTVVIFRPQRRLRYTKLSSAIAAEESEIYKLVETILGGAATFTNVKDQKLPPFAARPDGDAAKKDEL